MNAWRRRNSHRPLLFCLAIAAGVLFATADTRAAVEFTLDDYDVTVSADPGLAILAADVLPEPFSFTFEAPGDSITVDLFDIWTEERWANADDVAESPISVSFAFSAPPPLYGGMSTGVTGAARFLFLQGGTLQWDEPLELTYGQAGDGLIEIALSDEVFNWGIFGMNPGRENGATVQATVTLRDVAAVTPEPMTFVVWGGLAVLAASWHACRTLRKRNCLC